MPELIWQPFRLKTKEHLVVGKGKYKSVASGD